MKKSIKAISMIAVLTFSLTGCAYNNTVNEVNSALVETTSNEENSTSEATEPTSEETSSTTKETTSSSTIEEKPTTSTTATSTSSTVTKPTEKPAVSSSSSSKPVSSSSKPVSSSSKPTSTTTKPVSSSSKPTSSTTSSSTNKPTEKPTHTHNFTKATCTTPATCTSCGVTKGTVANHNYKDGHCTYCGKNDPNYVAPCKCDEFNPDDPNHDWEITYTTTEPKWCEEVHTVTDYGYDLTLAAKFLGVNEGKAYDIFTDNMDAIGVIGNSGNGTTTVKVWGTETYELRECKNCGLHIGGGNVGTITPMGEWQFLNGQNLRINDPRLDFNTIFYDPYNVPQKVIDNINLYWKLLWG